MHKFFAKQQPTTLRIKSFQSRKKCPGRQIDSKMDVDGRNNLKVVQAKLGLVSNYNFGPPLFIMILQNKQLTHFTVFFSGAQCAIFF